MFESFKNSITDYWVGLLPSPHLILLKGLTFGIDDLSNDPSFKSSLINTGTIHVAVVSGYNISLVVNVCSKLLGNRSSPFHIYVYILMSFLYAVLVGFAPPVVRAWLMSSVVLIAKIYGRVLNSAYVLIITVIVMILCDSGIVSSYSFLLSAGATLGLVLYSNTITHFFSKCEKIGKIIPFGDLSTSLAASLIVTPIISFGFGRISWISPFVNMLLLWTIPISTILGFLLVFVSCIDIVLHTCFAFLIVLCLYPFLEIFVQGIRFIGKYQWLTVEYKMTVFVLILYYMTLFLLPIVYKVIKINKK